MYLILAADYRSEDSDPGADPVEKKPNSEISGVTSRIRIRPTKPKQGKNWDSPDGNSFPDGP